MDVSNGFELLAADLEKIAGRVTDKRVKQKVLEAGAEPVVEHAKRNIRPHRRTGTLENSIRDEYDPKTGQQRIGWTNRGFYGRFHEDGYRPRPGIAIIRNGKRTWKNSRKNPRGRTVQNPHIRPAFAAERENVFRLMFSTLQKESGG